MMLSMRPCPMLRCYREKGRAQETRQHQNHCQKSLHALRKYSGELHFPCSVPIARPKACAKLPSREFFHKRFFGKSSPAMRRAGMSSGHGSSVADAGRKTAACVERLPGEFPLARSKVAPIVRSRTSQQSNGFYHRSLSHWSYSAPARHDFVHILGDIHPLYWRSRIKAASRISTLEYLI